MFRALKSIRLYASQAKVFPPLTKSEVFLNGSSANYLDEMYSAWLVSPTSVHLSWQVYFKNLISSNGNAPLFTTPPSSFISETGDSSLIDPELQRTLSKSVPSTEVLDHMKVQLMVRAYQVRGHQLAKLDPLEISGEVEENAPELTYKHYGFTDSDLDRKFILGSGILPLFKARESVTELSLRDIISRLKKTYCGPIGIEYGHIVDRASCDWYFNLVYFIL